MSAISEHLMRAYVAGGDLTAIEYRDAKVSWVALTRAVSKLREVLDAIWIDPREAVGLLGRNQLPALCGFAALAAGGHGMVLINALRPASLVAEELEELKLACILGEAADITGPVLDAAKRSGSVVVRLSVEGADVGAAEVVFEVLALRGPGPFRRVDEGTAIEIQTSGTTGKPKRIPILDRTIEASLRDGVRNTKGVVEQAQLKPASSPTLMFSPLVHTSGTFNTLMSLFQVRPIVLFEKFDTELYSQALSRYRPRFAALPPTALKMLVDSNVDPESFSSVKAVRAGTAPLSAELQTAFEDKFETPVLITYGATEFMGAIAMWTLEDHQRLGRAKIGSVGRPCAGVEMRVVDSETRAILPPDGQGVLEARVDRIDGGKAWIQTTDLARIDPDGFLFILGRLDDAIIRGGFKIMAEKVADAIRHAPGVHDALVVGLPDERLGEIPVAAVEAIEGATLTEQILRDYCKQHLAPYEVPAQILIVDRLPRTVSDKIARPAVRQLFADAGMR